jgi:dimethylhistidine N-methyltransferase
MPPSAAATDVFAAEVSEYLQRRPRQLPSKYFYDALGSSLFEAICQLPWYRITRAESCLLAVHAHAIAEMRPRTIAELGCGNGRKLATIVQQGGLDLDVVHLIDLSASALSAAAARLQAFPISRIVTHETAYLDGLARIRNDGDRPLLLLFLGSNIGNFDPPADANLLSAIRASLHDGDGLLLGTDLVKPEHELLLAYDDPLQVTAAFNKNLLRRINDELGGTFDLNRFAHRAVWNGAASRVEMHLVSRSRQNVRIDACDLDLIFEENEWIWTESSYKYNREQVVAMGAAAGFRATAQWIDTSARFAVTSFIVD